MGGRIEASINRIIAAHGFIEADAIVQFRPFRFHAQVAAGFSISVEDFSFASVQLTGKITGPGPMVVHGSLSISVFLFEISWDQTFTLGSGQGDPVPLPAPLLDILAGELGKHENVKTADGTDPDVALAPQAPTGEFALVPPTGKLQVAQRIAPLGLPLDRVRGLPLGAKQGAVLVGTGADVLDGFAPGSFLNLTDAEILNRKPFEDLPAGKLLTPAEPLPSDFPFVDETRTVEQIVIDMRSGKSTKHKDAAMIDLGPLSALAIAARAPPALSDPKPVLSARRESWGEIGTPQPQVYQSATAAHEFARIHGTVTVPVTDLTEPVALAGVL